MITIQTIDISVTTLARLRAIRKDFEMSEPSRHLNYEKVIIKLLNEHTKTKLKRT